MNENMVRISNVSKSYGQQLALDQVTIPIKRGQICGLVGENGAGKTTLLRILCGLSIPTEGEIEVSKNLKIGSLIEAPALYQNLSAYDNLKYLGLQLGLDQLNSRVEEVLDIIGLATVSKKKKSKNFSLGMRQRLAIGMAILDQPDFLILDEPINGLDPSGIKEVRKLLLKLKEKQGMTVLISSHLLSELEQIADYFVMMSKGKVLEILEQDQLSHKMKKNIYLATNDNLRMQDVLEEKNIDYQVDKDYLVLHLKDKPMTILPSTTLADIMTRDVRCVPPETPLREASLLMANERISSLLIGTPDAPLGIVTETNILRAVHVALPPETAVRNIMSQPLVTAPADLDLLGARHLVEKHHIRHLLVVAAEGQVVGMVSESDFRVHLGGMVFRHLRTLEGVMDRDMPRLPPGATLSEGIAAMLGATADYLIVAEHGRAAGIVTERDIPRLLATHADPQTIQLGEVMSTPLHTIVSATSVEQLHDLLAAANVSLSVQDVAQLDAASAEA